MCSCPRGIRRSSSAGGAGSTARLSLVHPCRISAVAVMVPPIAEQLAACYARHRERLLGALLDRDGSPRADAKAEVAGISRRRRHRPSPAAAPAPPAGCAMTHLSVRQWPLSNTSVRRRTGGSGRDPSRRGSQDNSRSVCRWPDLLLVVTVNFMMIPGLQRPAPGGNFGGFSDEPPAQLAQRFDPARRSVCCAEPMPVRPVDGPPLQQ